MISSKDYWNHLFEVVIEHLCKEHDIEWNQGEEMLISMLDKDPHYLESYCSRAIASKLLND